MNSIGRFTVVFWPIWGWSVYMTTCSFEAQGRSRGVLLANEYIYYAGVALTISAPILGLVFGVFLKRKHWPSWAVVIGGFVAGGILATVGIFMFAAAFFVV